MKHAVCIVLPLVVLVQLRLSCIAAGEASRTTSKPNIATEFKSNSEIASAIPSNPKLALDAKAARRRKLPLPELNGPFLMNQVAKEKAAESEEKITEDWGTSSSIDTKEVPPNSEKTNDQPRAAASLRNAIVSPMHERLLDDGTNENVNKRIDLSVDSERTRQEFAKLWWVNLWIQQLPSNNVDRRNHSSSAGDNIPEEARNLEVVEKYSTPEETAINQELPALQICHEKQTLQQAEDELQMSSANKSKLEVGIHAIDHSSSECFGVVENTYARGETAFVSSGMWVVIDNALTFGLARKSHNLRLSRRLRSTRKSFAKLTGFHGLLSGKSYSESRRLDPSSDFGSQQSRSSLGHDTSMAKSSGKQLDSANKDAWNDTEEEYDSRALFEIEQERKRLERVKTVDRLIAEGQERLQQLICEKDVLQRRPNPLFDYTTEAAKRLQSGGSTVEAPAFGMDHATSRQFKFPPDDLVNEYLEMIFWSRRLTKMNHTYLWKDTDQQDDDEKIGEDLLGLTADSAEVKMKGPNKNPRIRAKSAGGSWLLRQSIGKGPSLGEKIGESVERAAYKAVTGAVMSALARALSGLHGLNVLKNADISLMLEHSPDLPPLENTPTDYAHDALKKVFRTKARHRKKRHKPRSSDRAYIQKDAVTEMLLSQAQISAPLLQFFPQAWQRALLGNIITLSTAVISDFFDGLKFQVLGYQLSFSFKPITQEDMINHLGFTRANDRRGKVADFEAAVKATAQDIADELKFLDRWHERALGSGILRTQIANLIARVVLALVDDILRDSRMNLWSAHAGGPRIIAGLEYRTQTNRTTPDV